MLLYGRVELQDRLLKFMEDVWKEGTVVSDWKSAEIVSIPKKRNLKLCDNWQGISLLDVVGKIFCENPTRKITCDCRQNPPRVRVWFQKGERLCRYDFLQHGSL